MEETKKINARLKTTTEKLNHTSYIVSLESMMENYEKKYGKRSLVEIQDRYFGDK